MDPSTIRIGPWTFGASRCARIAVLAATAATIGDLLMLYVGNAPRLDPDWPRLGVIGLAVGAALGVVAIPLYAFGYAHASRVIETASGRGARWFLRTGVIGALVGGAIHGLTAMHVAESLEAGTLDVDPLSSLVSARTPILPLWAVAAALVSIASAIFAWCVGRGATTAPRRFALINPLGLTVVMAVVGLPFELGRSFLVPAAPNLAHLVFFVGGLIWLGGGPDRSGAYAATSRAEPRGASST